MSDQNATFHESQSIPPFRAMVTCACMVAFLCYFGWRVWSGAQEGTGAMRRLTSPHSNSVVRAQAAEELARSGTLPLPQLLSALSDKNPNVRRFVLYALHRTKEDVTSAEPHIYSRLEDEDTQVRTEALAALLILHGDAEEFARRCTLMLSDTEASVRSTAQDALAKLGAVSMPHLRDAAGHKDSQVRRGVVLSLGQFEVLSREGMETARQLLHDTDKAVRFDAFRVLVERGSATHEDLQFVLSQKDPAILLLALEQPSALFYPADDKLAAQLAKLMNHDDEGVQLLAAHRIRETGDAARTFAPELVSRCQDHRELHKLIAADSLGTINMHPELFVPVLADLVVETKDTPVAWWSANALKEFSPEVVAAIIPRLVLKLRRDDEELQQASLAALMGFGTLAESAIADLVKLLESNDAPIRTKARLALANIGPAASPAIPSLVKYARNELAASFATHFESSDNEFTSFPGSRRRSQDEVPVLIRISRTSIVDLWQQNRENDPTVATIVALGRIGLHDEQALATVKEFVDFPSRAARVAAAAAIADINCEPGEALAPLRLLINDESRSVRFSAAKAIGRLGLISEVAELNDAQSRRSQWLRNAAQQASSEKAAPSI